MFSPDHPDSLPELEELPDPDALVFIQPGDEILGHKVTAMLRSDALRQIWRGEAGGAARAVYVINPAVQGEAADRFRNCALSLMRLGKEASTQRFLKVHSVQPDGRAFIADLWDVGNVSDLPALGWELDRRLALFEQVCEALQGLHSLGLVHGNLLPEGIRLDDALTPVLADVGLRDAATLIEEPAWRPYVAPELARGEAPSIASDIYSAGQLLQFLLIEKDPPEVSGEDVPRLDVLAATAPAGLVRIIRQCLLADKTERYLWVADLLADVRNYAKWESVGRAHPLVVEVNKAAVVPLPAPPLAPPPSIGNRAPPQSAARPSRSMPAKKSAKSKQPAAYQPPPWVKAAWIGGLVVLVLSVLLGYALAIMPWGFRILSALGLAAIVQAIKLREQNHRIIAAVAAFVIGLVVNLGGQAVSAGSKDALKGGDPASTARAVRKMRASGVKVFEGAKLTGADLSGADLSDTRFTQIFFDNANLSNANFSGATFMSTELKGANVAGANFTGATLTLSNFDAAQCDARTVMPAGWVCKNGHPAH